MTHGSACGCAFFQFNISFSSHKRLTNKRSSTVALGGGPVFVPRVEYNAAVSVIEEDPITDNLRTSGCPVPEARVD